MSFTITKEHENIRLGVFVCLGTSQNEFKLQTPGLLFYTRTGLIPNVTPEVSQFLTKDQLILQLPLTTTIQYADVLKHYQKPIGEFIGMSEHLTYVTSQDPLQTIDHSKRQNSTVSVWTKSGKVEVTVERYMEIVEHFQPDMYYSLTDGDTNGSSSNKRSQKAVDRTVLFFDKCIKTHVNSSVLKTKTFIAGVTGGTNIVERERCVKRILEHSLIDEVKAFVIDGIHDKPNEMEYLNMNDIRPAIQATINQLPKSKPKIIHGCWNPCQMLDLISLGVDIFDTSYVHVITQLGLILNFSLADQTNTESLGFMYDIKEKKFADKFEPLVANCECMTCTNHTKAYVNHLSNVKELLCPLLITVHNLHHYIKFFKHIQDALELGTFENLKISMKKQYSEFESTELFRNMRNVKNTTDVRKEDEEVDIGEKRS